MMLFNVPFLQFIAVHQTLFGTVIGKHGIFAQFGAAGAILAVLQSLEGAVDAFAFSLIALIPTRTSTVQIGVRQLGTTLTNTIHTYEKICIPSPFYPRFMPLCTDLGH
ncbi:hypothetical protein D9619_010861 [Psilocybe cf. subviscida]|uniref:Uncharacterized protein n=1 Tax=Psilocybe cf. subviscida TaxID=2480587 RepID=A0A8H5F0A8_9AGAR|nr:hypothetical protein D9619_010861 [Psilocybe cf. subviscida]